ncbi:MULTISPECIES: metal ABC transporter solute-binding protein, Zn/Mn family [unclassified Acidocella]|uniref:metal ABC transporter solute-binding protein, Zn/Mn family n=1 Tax=unclassified Acidocella TaxID=2648610 RepID=UPI00028C7B67|nr:MULTISPECIES: zinc ABC transporter substrate-binding protein [unclassified Acidocella]EKM99375.1 zinc ABC transporter periplasmic-binding protein ZnuA [Acidocella sp. MX-AZ02]WBO58021.1 zinc ABC transporter substrate-binding protein [Acidocella sp. MX-AZ03]
MLFHRIGLALVFGLAGHLAMAQPVLHAVGLENQYADVLAQIGGPYVKVSAIQSDPNTDPHEFEATPRIAAQFRKADLVVENGLGYDSWAAQLLKGGHAKLLSAQALLKLPDSTPNPHLWYRTDTMPAVAAAAAAFFEAKDPAHKAQYQANLKAFDAALAPWKAEIAKVKEDYAGAPVAVTEPVADDLLQEAGLKIMTPFSYELSVMNDTDPAPQDVAAEEALLRDNKVKLFAYNEQVTDPQTEALLALARQHQVQIVPVYELMPSSAKHYQDWMLQATTALNRALAAK